VFPASGETGVRLQYSHARLHSLVERAEVDLDLNTSTLPLQEEAAFQLVHVIGEKKWCRIYRVAAINPEF
jgi:arginyl-tRNA synthetase